MKFQKTIAIALSVAALLTMTACGSTSEPAATTAAATTAASSKGQRHQHGQHKRNRFFHNKFPFFLHRHLLFRPTMAGRISAKGHRSSGRISHRCSSLRSWGKKWQHVPLPPAAGG